MNQPYPVSASALLLCFVVWCASFGTDIIVLEADTVKKDECKCPQQRIQALTGNPIT